MYIYWNSLGNIIVCHEPVTDPRLVAIHVQALCTGQRLTKEMFTGNAGVKFAPAHYNPMAIDETYLHVCSVSVVVSEID